MNLFTEQKWAHRHRKTNLWLSNGQQVRGREINEEFGINIYTL